MVGSTDWRRGRLATWFHRYRQQAGSDRLGGPVQWRSVQAGSCHRGLITVNVNRKNPSLPTEVCTGKARRANSHNGVPAICVRQWSLKAVRLIRTGTRETHLGQEKKPVGLFLARNSARQHEFAIRGALGAGRARLMRQLLVESPMLAIPGALLGIGLAWLAGPWMLHSLGNSEAEIALSMRPDFAVLAITTLCACVCALVFGRAPAWLASRTEVEGALRASHPWPALCQDAQRRPDQSGVIGIAISDRSEREECDFDRRPLRPRGQRRYDPPASS